MKPLTKILLTLAMALVFIGAIACVATYIISDKSLSALGIETSYEQTEYAFEPAEDEEKTEFSEINIIVDRHHVVVKQSSEVEEIHITYAENQYDKFTVTQIKDKFFFTNEGLKNMFFRRFCLLFDAKKEKTELNTVEVTLPTAFEGKLNIKCTNADLQIYGVSGISDLSVTCDGADASVDYVIAPKADISMKNGNLTVSGGAIEDCRIKLTNKGVYVPIEEENPEGTAEPTETVVPTELPEESVEPEESIEPEETVSPEATEDPDATVSPDETPLPTKTPKPTPVPKKLVIENTIRFENADFQKLEITTTNTDIIGNIIRNALFYNITTNNTESSNIENYENKSTQGTIVINQNGGATELYFK